MPRPTHVTLMQLLRQLANTGLPEGQVVVELPVDSFDQALEYLQNQPGRANQPTDVGADNFKIGNIEVRRI